MPRTTTEKLLDRLDELKIPGDAGVRARLRAALSEAARRDFKEAASLIRFHEILLFTRAYPQGRALLRQTDAALSGFRRRVERLLDADPEASSELSQPEVSGIAGTTFSAAFGYHIARWLAARYPSRVRLDLEGYGSHWQFAAVMRRLVPMLEEAVYVESHIAVDALVRAAKGRARSDLAWLMEGFERMGVSDDERAALYDSLGLFVRWELGDSSAARTHTRLRRSRAVFYHDSPLLARRDVSLGRELAPDAPPLKVSKLSRAEGERLLDLGRGTMAARYRELHGFAHGEPGSVLRAEAGRGVEIFLWGVPAPRRLPTLAYHAVLVLKNGVPCGYAEALTLFERSEVGVNLFYTFREGESAWVYSRVLRLFRQALGVKVFSVEPYQLGSHNEEGIASGAFWFYRKLGFRPVKARVAELAAREERRLAARPGRRTTARTLRALAEGHVLYEAPDAATGEWDDFHLPNVALAVARRMARRYGGDAESARRESADEVARALGISASALGREARRALENLSLTLALVPGLSRWTEDERAAVVKIIRAKAGPDETRYLRLLNGHARLRRELIRLGSARRRG